MRKLQEKVFQLSNTKEKHDRSWKYKAGGANSVEIWQILIKKVIIIVKINNLLSHGRCCRLAWSRVFA